MTRAEWLELGIREGFCSPPVCITHDGWPTTIVEDEEEDACIHLIRCYRNDAERVDVEANNSATVWRKAGWVNE